MPRYDFEDKLKTLKSVSPLINGFAHNDIKDVVACSEAADEKEDETKDSPVEFNFSQNKLNERLFKAVRRGDVKAAKKAIEGGANIEAIDVYGYRPLYIAALYGHTKTAQLLIDNNAIINAADEYGRTPLRAAISWERKKTAALLKQHGGV